MTKDAADDEEKAPELVKQYGQLRLRAVVAATIIKANSADKTPYKDVAPPQRAAMALEVRLDKRTDTNSPRHQLIVE